MVRERALVKGMISLLILDELLAGDAYGYQLMKRISEVLGERLQKDQDVLYNGKGKEAPRGAPGSPQKGQQHSREDRNGRGEKADEGKRSSGLTQLLLACLISPPEEEVVQDRRGVIKCSTHVEWIVKGDLHKNGSKGNCNRIGHVPCEVL